MYGTVSEICIALLKQHENNKKIAVITWTPCPVAPDGSRNEHSALSEGGHGCRGMRRAGYAQNPDGSAVYAASR